ncbi:hypothetical protein SAMN02746089_02057 [Caldanaerobius fijiensis DSM 17918]|uniref:Uncharacterized protein n=1 Tax=Caldanaerobius fijiensis DSM 17918 TaxID=1121256 RepID=A0A1M5C8A2_9THEO|nr:hypothetical protein SAMN02746089_02057 [Caldanaerobius fijiensis DSM 17918]
MTSPTPFFLKGICFFPAWLFRNIGFPDSKLHVRSVLYAIVEISCRLHQYYYISALNQPAIPKITPATVRNGVNAIALFKIYTFLHIIIIEYTDAITIASASINPNLCKPSNAPNMPYSSTSFKSIPPLLTTQIKYVKPNPTARPVRLLVTDRLLYSRYRMYTTASIYPAMSASFGIRPEPPHG